MNRRPVYRTQTIKVEWHTKTMSTERIVKKSIEAKELGEAENEWIPSKRMDRKELDKTTGDREKWKKFVEATRR